MEVTQYKRRCGDRRDGRLLRTLAPFYRFTPFVMKQRGDASNYYEDKFEVRAAETLVRELRTEGLKNLGLLHVFLAAYVRVVAMFPQLNRFCAGQRIYARNRIEVSMVVKKRLSNDAGETSFKVVFEPTDTLREVYEKVNTEVEKIKNETPGNETEDTASGLIKLPRLLLKFVMFMLTMLDYFGKLPQSIIAASPFHSSLVISDLGSLGIGKIYHHLYNFGNLPIFIAFGRKYRTWEPDKNGEVVERRYIDYGVVTDERICDGYCYALSFRHFNHFLTNPAELTVPPETVNRDID